MCRTGGLEHRETTTRTRHHHRNREPSRTRRSENLRHHLKNHVENECRTENANANPLFRRGKFATRTESSLTATRRTPRRHAQPPAPSPTHHRVQCFLLQLRTRPRRDRHVADTPHRRPARPQRDPRLARLRLVRHTGTVRQVPIRRFPRHAFVKTVGRLAASPERLISTMTHEPRIKTTTRRRGVETTELNRSRA